VIKRRTWLIYLFSLPSDLIATLLLLVLAPFQSGLGLCLERRPDAPGLWALSLDVDGLHGVYMAVTIAPHVMFYRSGCHFGQGWSQLQDYEHQRCERLEVSSLAGALLGLGSFVLGAPWFVALALWMPAPWVYMIASYAVAWLRGEDPSRGAHNEEASYALAAQSGKR
jgi:hypothetical protein